jgi:hypothetical protein
MLLFLDWQVCWRDRPPRRENAGHCVSHWDTDFPRAEQVNAPVRRHQTRSNRAYLFLAGARISGNFCAKQMACRDTQPTHAQCNQHAYSRKILHI